MSACWRSGVLPLPDLTSFANLHFNMNLLPQPALSTRLAQVIRALAAVGLMAGLGAAGLPAAAQAFVRSTNPLELLPAPTYRRSSSPWPTA